MFVAIIFIVISLIISYLLGSMSFAVLVSRWFVNKDVRSLGSGNAGMTNVVRTIGVVPGIITFLLDVLKGFVACALGRWLVFPYICNTLNVEWAVPVYGAFLCGIFCQLGHVFPLFFEFRGGKGVAVAVGIMLVCNPIATAISLGVFIVLFAITRIVSLGSLASAICVTAMTCVFYDKTGPIEYTRWIQTALCFIFTAIIFLRHRNNIDRISKGEEKPLVLEKEE